MFPQPREKALVSLLLCRSSLNTKTWQTDSFCHSREGFFMTGGTHYLTPEWTFFFSNERVFFLFLIRNFVTITTTKKARPHIYLVFTPFSYTFTMEERSPREVFSQLSKVTVTSVPELPFLGWNWYNHVCVCLCVSVCLCICLSVHLSVCASVCLCICRSVHLSVCVCVCVCLTVCHSVCLSVHVCVCICLSVHLCVYPSVCLSVGVSVGVCIWLSVWAKTWPNRVQ